MSEMIERVAKALAANSCSYAAAPEFWRVKARAAIEAMTVPSEAMVWAGATDNTPRTATNSLDRMTESVGHIYRAMIGAALA